MLRCRISKRAVAAVAIASALGFTSWGIVGTGTAFAGAKSASSQVSASVVGNEHAVEASHADSVAQAAADCAVASGVFRTYYNGCVNWTNYACVAGHHFNITPPNYVSDGCNQTIQLWSGANETGSVICIPHGPSGYLHTAWHSFDITGSGAC